MAFRSLPFKTGHIFIALAVLMGGLTLVLSRSPEQKPLPLSLNQKAMEIKTIDVVVPLNTISRGKVIQLADITVVKWPRDYLPTRGQWFEKSDDVAGHIARQELYPGEPLFVDKVSGNGNGSGLPALIPPGMRAVTVAVTEIKGVAGFVKPGDHVDVLGTFEVERQVGEKGQGSERVRLARTVLQNVLVLAAAQTMAEADKTDGMQTPDAVKRGELTPTPKSDAKEDKADVKAEKPDEKSASSSKKDDADSEKGAKLVSSVTLALSPKQTEALALAEEAGEIRLSLRSELDRSVQTLRGINLEQVTGIRQTAPKLAVEGKVSDTSPKGPHVEVIQGTEKSLHYFQ